MRLNYDAVRGVLMYLGEYLGYVDSTSDLPHKHQTMVTGIIVNGAITNYSENETLFNNQDAIYAVEQLINNGYLETNGIKYVDGDMVFARVRDITWSGHELLKSLENEQVWNAVKEISVKRGGMPIGVLAKVCGQLSMLAMTQPDALLNVEKAITTCFGLL